MCAHEKHQIFSISALYLILLLCCLLPFIANKVCWHFNNFFI